MNTDELLDEIDTARRTSRRVWDISHQNLSTLPLSFFSLTSLSVLHLHHNNFVSLSPEICNLTEISVLDLSSNRINEIPAEICQLTKLTSLFLHDNELQALPAGFSGLSELKILSLGCNKIEGQVPSDIYSLENLISFSCCANRISSFPLDIIKLSRLTSLNLAMNNLTTIPETATLPSTLTYLNISTNNLSAIPPKFLNNLPSLKTLNLSYNSILEFPLEHFGVDSNYIFQLTTLSALQLDNNQLTNLPKRISEMTHLLTLTLDGNPLPPAVLELNRTLKIDHFLFRVRVGAANSLAHHVHDVINQQKELTRLHSASNDRLDPRRMVVHNKEIGQLAKITNLNTTDIEQLFDEEGGKSMSKEGFQKVVTKAGYSIATDPTLIDSAFSLFDMNGNGTVDMKELVVGFTVLEQGSLVQKLKFGFHLYDINHDGSIEKNELKVMLMKIGAMRGYPKSRSPAITSSKIEEFISKVYDSKEVLHFEDFAEAAFSDPYIMDLFSLDQFFQRHPPRSSLPSPHSMRKAESLMYSDPKKLLIKKRETRELAKLTHMKPSELLKLFDLEGSEGQERGGETGSMSREKFKEMMAGTGLLLARDPALLDALFDIFDMSETVERKELLVGLITLNSGTLTQKIKLGFHLYDANGDGSIEKQELRGMLTKIAALQPNRSSSLLNSEIEDFVNRMYTGRRLLVFSDFLVAAQSDSHIAQLFALESIFRTH